MPQQAHEFYEFGPFQLDCSERVLRRDGRPVTLTPKAFQTLLVLVENSGHVVEKETLLRLVWPDTFVEEATLAQNVSTLRRVLCEDDDTPYIETVPKRGYRFVRSVRKAETASPATGPADPAPDGQNQRSLRQKPRAIYVYALGAAGVVLLAGIAIYFAQHHARPPQTSGSSPNRVMLAVLPFSNLTGDPGQEYMCDGLTEETISQLGMLNPHQLGVIARTSSMAYKTTSKTIGQIGRELGVDYVLEGSVRGTAGQIRVTTQLIRVRDQTHVWSHEYNRVAKDVLSVQSDISQAVADEVDVSLSPQRRVPSNAAPVHSEAYDLYLRGRFHWNKRSREGLAKGIEYFQQAIAQDSSYAPAYAGLADCLFLQTWITDLPREQVMPQAKIAARRAIELDPRLAEPHASLGIIAVSELDWPEAEREFNRALDLNSNYPTAHHWNGIRLAAIGKPADGIAEVRRAIELDPLSPILYTELGWLATLDHNYKSAIEALNKALELDSNFYLAHAYLARTYEQQREYPVAIAEMQKALELSAGKPELQARLGRLYALAGRTSEAEKLLSDLQKESKHRPLSSMYPAFVYSGLNDKEKELAMLERAVTEGNNSEVAWFKVDPTYDTVRTDPRFQEILQRSGLSSNGSEPAKP